MLGILYLVLAFTLGYALCETIFPNLKNAGKKTFDGRDIELSSWLIRVPAWGIFGILLMTWATYLTAYALKVFGGATYPLGPANAIVMCFFAALTVALLFVLYKKNKKSEKTVNAKLRIFEWIFLSLVTLLIVRMMFLTFFISDGRMYVGLSVFSDFAPHLGMIRSFSFGNNFPTAYSHYAGEDVRYHFLFQFLVGNLEFLGLRLDFAFNLPSIFGLLATCLLLYTLAVRIAGKRSVGYLTTLFFLFRSSPSFFRYLATLPKGKVLKNVLEQTEFIAFTQNEDWGFWNLNVYCNQRHLAFALAAMLLALHIFLPYVYRMAGKLAKIEKQPSEKGVFFAFADYVGKCLKTLFVTRSAFGIRHPFASLFMGVILGGLAFFNGSVLIATCCMLFFLAAVSDERLDYLITAVTALCLSLLESRLFVNGSVVSPKYYFGFLAENRTFFGAVDYMWQLWGILILFILGYLILGKGVKRYLTIVFFVPLALAFTLSLTPDIGVNHKFVMMAEMLLSLFPAMVIGELLEKSCAFLTNRVFLRRFAGGLLIFLLTVTGIFEYTIVERRNVKNNNLVFDCNDPVTMWFKENANSDDVILSSWYHLHRVVLGGGMLYYGWPYYAWSAGYDTEYREKMVRRMYMANTPEELDTLIKQNKIRFIIVDQDARENTSYYVHEEVIAATYEAVYSEGEDIYRFTVYDTQKPLPRKE